MSDRRDPPSAEDQPPGVSGKWVLVALLLASICVVIVGLLVVRPDPDAPPAPPADRPFGPGKSHHSTIDDDVPLLHRSSAEEDPPTTADQQPARSSAAAPSDPHD